MLIVIRGVISIRHNTPDAGNYRQLNGFRWRGGVSRRFIACGGSAAFCEFLKFVNRTTQSSDINKTWPKANEYKHIFSGILTPKYVLINTIIIYYICINLKIVLRWWKITCVETANAGKKIICVYWSYMLISFVIHKRYWVVL